MKSLTLIMALLLAGCTTVPVKQTFPAVPDILKEPCENLSVIPADTTSIVDFTKVVVSNYELYFKCQNKNNGWREWYDTQKRIFEKANK